MLEEERFEEFSSLLTSIQSSIQKLKARYTAQLGLKAVHISWIYLLNLHPEGMSASELAAAGQLDRSLVSRELPELFDKGIIFTEDGGDKRRYGWKLKLTEKGQRLAEIISAVITEGQNVASQDVPEKDLVAFYDTLRKLAAGLKGFENNNHAQDVINELMLEEEME